MESTILRLSPSFGSDFGKLSAIGFSYYFLVHTFKIKKTWIDTINRIRRYEELVKTFIRLLIRKSSFDLREILVGSIPSRHLSTKQPNATIFILYLYISLYYIIIFYFYIFIFLYFNISIFYVFIFEYFYIFIF